MFRTAHSRLVELANVLRNSLLPNVQNCLEIVYEN